MPRLSPADRAVRRAGLRHSSDADPGLRRVVRGRGFGYVDTDGKPVRDAETLARIRALAIPPAYTDVWICADPNGHVQATGRDARGRKQYRYHAAWREVRAASTYGALADLGARLPALRRRVAADLRSGAGGDLTRERVLALVVTLLDTSHQRIGSREYARANGTYGLSTLLDRHATVDGAALRLRFRGKHGLWREVELRDRRLARLVQRCRELPGQTLFQYEDAATGEVRAIASTDVNAYLAEACGVPVTAKHFRTWGGSLAFACAVAGADDGLACDACIAAALDATAAHLGNTVAVCRGHYVHPALLESAADGTFTDRWAAARRGRTPRGLDPDEAALLRFVRAA